MAEMIDATAHNCRNASVLSIACGHFREALASKAATAGAIKLTGLDHDPKSLAYVEKNVSNGAVKLINASVRDFLRKKIELGKFDLVYASGLNDYLDDHICKRLCAMLFEILKPGGKLIIPNFLPTAINRASMEYLQDWFLIYRDEIQIRRLTEKICADAIGRIEYFSDDTDSIGYVVVTKS